MVFSIRPSPSGFGALPAETAAEMATRGPRARIVEFPGDGHTPALVDDAQIATIRDWLATTPPSS